MYALLCDVIPNSGLHWWSHCMCTPNSCDFLFASLDNISLLKWLQLLKEKMLPEEQQRPSTVDRMIELSALKVYPCTLKAFPINC